MMTSVNVITNSSSQNYIHPGEHSLPTYDMNPGVEPNTLLKLKAFTREFVCFFLKNSFIYME